MTKQEEFNQAVDCNNLNLVKLLLNNPKVDPTEHFNNAIRISSRKGYLKIVDLLLKDKRVDPSDFFNGAFTQAYFENHINILKLLWKDKRVKETLAQDKIKIYHKLIKENVVNKINCF